MISSGRSPVRGSILKPTETDAVIDNYWGTIAGYIRWDEGYSDDYISTLFGISGVFQNNEDQFDSARHKVLISVVSKDSRGHGRRHLPD